MVNLVYDLAKRIVEKADAREREEKERKKEARERESRDWGELKAKVRSKIMESLEVIKNRMIAEDHHIKVGDRVVVNKYGIGRKSSNTWDTGASILWNGTLQYTKENPGPVYAEILWIRVSTGVTSEWFDSWFESEAPKYSKDELLSKTITLFVNWLRLKKDAFSRDSGIFKSSNFGMYMEAGFKLEGIRGPEPSWGLNSNSFLNVESDAGKATIELWEEENELEEVSKRTKKLEEAFQKKKENAILTSGIY